MWYEHVRLTEIFMFLWSFDFWSRVSMQMWFQWSILQPENPPESFLYLETMQVMFMSHFQTPERELKIWRTVGNCEKLRSVWKCHEILSGEFYIHLLNQNYLLIKIRYLNQSTMVMIFLVVTWWIIDEIFEKSFSY